MLHGDALERSRSESMQLLTVATQISEDPARNFRLCPRDSERVNGLRLGISYVLCTSRLLWFRNHRWNIQPRQRHEELPSIPRIPCPFDREGSRLTGDNETRSLLDDDDDDELAIQE